MMSPDKQEGDKNKQAMYYENHPAYTEQRLKLESTFAGKGDDIAEQFHQFRLEGPANTRTKTWEKNTLAEDANAQLISNNASFDVLQYQDKSSRAGMSMVHILAIPRAPIYNGVSLTRKNACIIDEMIRLFEHSWARPEVRQDVLRHQLQAIELRAKELEHDAYSALARQAALAHYAELEAMIESLDLQDFQYGLHLRPDNSADSLHLHIIAAPYEFRKYSTAEHDRKTKDAYEVRDFIVKSAR
jgi:hypothetical protein